MQRFWRTALTLVLLVVVAALDAHAQRAQRTLKPAELACFRRLFLQGPAKCEAQQLLDRGWANRANDGTIFLTADGLEVAKMNGLAHDGGGTQPTKHTQPSWWKRCELATAIFTSEEGLETRKTGKVCTTYYQRMGDRGLLIVGAGLWRMEGVVKQGFYVIMPPTTQVRPGLRVSIFPKDVWDKLQKQAKITRRDAAKGKDLEVGNTYCAPSSRDPTRGPTYCSVTVEATPALISDLQTHGGFGVFATASTGAPVAVSVPLDDFAQALAGPSTEDLAPIKVLQCAAAEWRGCSMKPIPEWGR
jgi:invasion protein IalB